MFNVTWEECENPGNCYGTSGPATASATFTMDTKDIPAGHQGPTTGLISMDKIDTLSVTVTGAGAGNGTFGKSDFASMVFSFQGHLDFNGELLGQGSDPSSGVFGGMQSSFNLIANSYGTVGGPAAAPSGVSQFIMITNGKLNFDSPGPYPEMYTLYVTSIIATPLAAVPEPETYAMLLGGLGLIGVAARRRKSRAFGSLI